MQKGTILILHLSNAAGQDATINSLALINLKTIGTVGAKLVSQPYTGADGQERKLAVKTVNSSVQVAQKLSAMVLY